MEISSVKYSNSTTVEPAGYHRHSKWLKCTNIYIQTPYIPQYALIHAVGNVLALQQRLKLCSFRIQPIRGKENEYLSWIGCFASASHKSIKLHKLDFHFRQPLQKSLWISGFSVNYLESCSTEKFINNWIMNRQGFTVHIQLGNFFPSNVWFTF